MNTYTRTRTYLFINICFDSHMALWKECKRFIAQRRGSSKYTTRRLNELTICQTSRRYQNCKRNVSDLSVKALERSLVQYSTDEKFVCMYRLLNNCLFILSERFDRRTINLSIKRNFATLLSTLCLVK